MLSIKEKRIVECIITHCLNIEEDIENPFARLTLAESIGGA